MMKIAILTVVYPDSENFFIDYVKNLNKLKLRNVGLVIVIDNFKKDLTYLKKKLKNFSYYFIHSNSSLIKNRINGLKFCLNKNYDLVVCNDIDDLFYKNSIKNIRIFFNKHSKEPLAFSNLIYKKDTKMIYFNKKKKYISINDVIDYNFLGYGALAIKKELIPFLIKVLKENPIIPDWYFVLKYLILYKKIKIITNSKIFYREHKKNQLGPQRGINHKRIIDSLNVKINVYSKMVSFCNSINNHNALLFRKKLREQIKLKKILQNKKFINLYIQFIKKILSKKKSIYWFQESYYCNKFIKKYYEN